MRSMMLAAAAALGMTGPAMADMTIVCEHAWLADVERIEVTVDVAGKPSISHTVSGEPVAGFATDPAVLGYTTTPSGKSGTPFSSIMIESRADDGATSPARVIYIDWGRAQVWMTFMNMLDQAGGKQLANCVRTD